MNKLAYLEGYMGKKAVNLEGLRKAYIPLKKNVSRIRRSVIADRKGPSMMTLVNKANSGRLKKANSIGFGPLLIKTPKGEYSVISKGNTLKQIKEQLKITGVDTPSFSNKEKEITQRIFGLHEGFEAKASKDPKSILNQIKQQWGGHADPSVIMRENNIIATLPKEHKKVKEFFRNIRKQDRTIIDLERSIPGFKYGETRVPSKSVDRLSSIVREKLLAIRAGTQVVKI